MGSHIEPAVSSVLCWEKSAVQGGVSSSLIWEIPGLYFDALSSLTPNLSLKAAQEHSTAPLNIKGSCSVITATWICYAFNIHGVVLKQ